MYQSDLLSTCCWCSVLMSQGLAGLESGVKGKSHSAEADGRRVSLVILLGIQHHVGSACGKEAMVTSLLVFSEAMAGQLGLGA